MNMQSNKSHVCNVEGRRFATAAALTQHKMTVHRNSVPQRGAPARRRGRGFFRGRRGGATRAPRTTTNGCSTSGSDLIKVVTADGTSKAGDVVLDVVINPLSFAGTRLAAEAALWTRWRPQMLRMEIQPSASTLVSGTYAIGWVSNPSEIFTKSNSMQRVSAMRPSAAGNVYTKLVMDIPVETTQKWLYVSTRDMEDGAQGRILVVLTSAIGGVTGNSQISFVMRLMWRLAFEGPIIPNAMSEVGIYAEDDYAGYYTDSVGDWASGKRLSLKVRAGGNLVPFPEAQPGIVYKLDKSATLTYNIDGAKTGKVGYGVLIRNYYNKAFAVFAKQEDAAKYAVDGDATHGLLYESAGPIVTPDNPAWYETSASANVEVQELQKKVDDLTRKLDWYMNLVQPLEKSAKIVELGSTSSTIEELDFPETSSENTLS